MLYFASDIFGIVNNAFYYWMHSLIQCLEIKVVCTNKTTATMWNEENKISSRLFVKIMETLNFSHPHKITEDYLPTKGAEPPLYV